MSQIHAGKIATCKLDDYYYFGRRDRVVCAFRTHTLTRLPNSLCSWFAIWLVDLPISFNILLHCLTALRLCFGKERHLFRITGATHSCILSWILGQVMSSVEQCVFQLCSEFGRSHQKSSRPILFLSILQSTVPYQ